ncbi:MAG: hypothetical protein OHK0053_14740 [Microscillaceae bacterium]
MARDALPTQAGILALCREHPDRLLKEIPRLQLPTYCEVKAKDVDLKRLGSILWLAQENEVRQFEDLLLLKGLGPRTLQSLTLVSEVIHGTPSRFQDPARFSFAHGSKNGRPFPVPTRVYDETIHTLRKAVEKARLGQLDKHKALQKLTQLAQKAEAGFTPQDNFEALLEKEKRESAQYGGRTAKGTRKPPASGQLKLF